MTRVEEVRSEAAKVTRREEIFARLASGALRGDAERLAREELHALDDELAALKAKSAPAAPPPVLPDVAKLSREDAAKRALEIAADPRYWDPSKADKDGVRLTAEQHDRLVRERSELLARAAEAS